jgi:hypothetical protein
MQRQLDDAALVEIGAAHLELRFDQRDQPVRVARQARSGSIKISQFAIGSKLQHRLDQSN